MKLCRLGRIFGKPLKEERGVINPPTTSGRGGCSFDEGLQGTGLEESLKSRLIVRRDKTQHLKTATWERLVCFHLLA